MSTLELNNAALSAEEIATSHVGIRLVTEHLLRKVAKPVIHATLEQRLKQSMPVEARQGRGEGRAQFAHLEAVGRLLCGMAPMLELKASNSSSGVDVDVANARQVIDSVTEPKSGDYLNYLQGAQSLVDTAFFAQGMVRAPCALWGGLDDRVRANVVSALVSTRMIRPGFNNWLLFSAMIEAIFFTVGESYDRMRIDYALRQHEQWYLGDGHYGDGPEFHWDYYNSYVTLPMLLDILTAVRGQFADWDLMYDRVLGRAQRYAVVLERLIGADGAFPTIGRSLAYRCGAFHLLVQLSLLKLLPNTLSPALVRCALLAVIQKTLGAASNFDSNGWLTIGINGHQPSIGESYISTGSLYLCSTAFVTLDLPESDPFWDDPDQPWTQRRLWTLSENLLPDKALTQ